jgi:hypothetical protein
MTSANRLLLIPLNLAEHRRARWQRLAVELSGRPEGVTPAQLFEAAGLRDPSHALKILRRLEAAGILTSEPGEVPQVRSPGKRPIVFRARRKGGA